jgi:hypothetical protein
LTGVEEAESRPPPQMGRPARCRRAHLDVVIVRGGIAASMVIDRLLVADSPALVTCTTRDAVPAVVGVPVMAPDALRLRPAGRLPEDTAQL